MSSLGANLLLVQNHWKRKGSVIKANPVQGQHLQDLIRATVWKFKAYFPLNVSIYLICCTIEIREQCTCPTIRQYLYQNPPPNSRTPLSDQTTAERNNTLFTERHLLGPAFSPILVYTSGKHWKQSQEVYQSKCPSTPITGGCLKYTVVHVCYGILCCLFFFF